MKIALEVTGGFTGKAGKQVIQVDTDHLKPADAARLHRDLEQLPDHTWGQSFESAQPQPWDFLHKLTVTDESGEKTVCFHLNQGPSGLSRIAEQLKDLDNAGHAGTGSSG